MSDIFLTPEKAQALANGLDKDSPLKVVTQTTYLVVDTRERELQPTEIPLPKTPSPVQVEYRDYWRILNKNQFSPEVKISLIKLIRFLSKLDLRTSKEIADYLCKGKNDYFEDLKNQIASREALHIKSLVYNDGQVLRHLLNITCPSLDGEQLEQLVELIINPDND
jgi:hypothetical protein